jgi:hypothetical protein
MIQRDVYLMNAALLCAMAEAEKDSAIRADLENMAYAYLRLAQPGRNDVVYGNPPPPKGRDQSYAEAILWKRHLRRENGLSKGSVLIE